MKAKYIVGGVIIAASLVWAIISFQSSLTPYVSVENAKTAESFVQVKGERMGFGEFNVEENSFTFTIKDEQGEILNVLYDGAKPGNFDQASHVVCVGKYKDGKFHAKDILVKCPSKYQEEGANI
jgi:cytochrome c-type biogenesis protein CcmE